LKKNRRQRYQDLQDYQVFWNKKSHYSGVAVLPNELGRGAFMGAKIIHIFEFVQKNENYFFDDWDCRTKTTKTCRNTFSDRIFFNFLLIFNF